MFRSGDERGGLTVRAEGTNITVVEETGQQEETKRKKSGV